ncbi:MAG: nickel pincer cofactor biosynthesis protein LarC [Cyclobacteriaceae bacterium]
MGILYIEPFAGVAGDMLLSALCGLCDGYEEIKKLPSRLNLQDGKVEVKTVNKNGIVCLHVQIVDLNGHEHRHGHHHSHGHAHGHSHRHLSDINKIIDQADITARAKKIARDIFQIIGKSESKVHNIPLEKIHFHEVSAVDSILDIVGCAVMLDKLGITRTYSGAVCVGSGTVMTQHGVLPVPAPATADILTGMPTFKGNEPGEKTTPTGAAVLKYLNPDFRETTLQVQRSAYGPGTKDFEVANVVRVSLLSEGTEDQGKMYVIETQLDDTSPEMIGADFQDSLLSTGATDFYFTAVQMKKGRPGIKFSVLVEGSNLEDVVDFILDNCPTIGVRYYPVQRKVLERNQLEINTELGPVQVKEVVRPSGRKDRKIEYDCLRSISEQQNLSLLETSNILQSLINKKS